MMSIQAAGLRSRRRAPPTEVLKQKGSQWRARVIYDKDKNKPSEVGPALKTHGSSIPQRLRTGRHHPAARPIAQATPAAVCPVGRRHRKVLESLPGEDSKG